MTVGIAREPVDRSTDTILRIKEVLQRTGLHRATIYRMEKVGGFPRKLQLSPGCVGFYKSDIEAWIAEREPRAAA